VDRGHAFYRNSKLWTSQKELKKRVFEDFSHTERETEEKLMKVKKRRELLSWGRCGDRGWFPGGRGKVLLFNGEKPLPDGYQVPEGKTRVACLNRRARLRDRGRVKLSALPCDPRKKKEGGGGTRQPQVVWGGAGGNHRSSRKSGRIQKRQDPQKNTKQLLRKREE